MQANTRHVPESVSVEPRSIPPQHGRVTVIGIGNTLMCDDGAGVHVVDVLRRRLADRLEQSNKQSNKQSNIRGGREIRLLDGGTLSFTLLDEVEQTDYLIVVDAAQFEAEPGTVRVLQQAEMDVYLGNNVRPSVHEVNLLDVLTAARLRGSMPPRYALVGIQPERIGWSTNPSDTVAASVQQAANRIESLIDALLEPAGAAERPA